MKLKTAAILVAVAVAMQALAALQVTVTATSGKVEHLVPGASSWARTRVGTKLGIGSQVRTGKRSSAELRLPDTTTYRLGPQSLLKIQAISPNEASLSRGGVFARVIKGSAVRLRGRYGTVAVRGTKVALEIIGDREYVRVWDGEAEYETPQGIIRLPAESGTWMIEGQRPLEPRPVEPDAFAGGQMLPWWESVRTGVQMDAVPASPAVEAERLDRAVQDEQIRQGEPAREALRQPTGSIAVELQQVGGIGAVGAGGSAGAFGASAVGALSVASVSLHSQPRPPVGRMLGRKIYGPFAAAQVYGLWGESGSFGGARARVRIVADQTLLQVAGRVDAQSGDDADWLLDETFAAWKGEEGDLLVGRNRILEGPVNNSDYGTLLGFGLTDGVRGHLWLGRRRVLTLAWLEDFDNLYEDDVGGFYGRLSTFLAGGNLAVAVLSQRHEGTGVAAQFSLPMIRDYVDLYGEVGDDPYGNHLETVGLYFPELYQTADIDLYVERAQRHGGDTLSSLHAYWQFEENASLVSVVQHSRMEGWRLGIGLIANIGGL